MAQNPYPNLQRAIARMAGFGALFVIVAGLAGGCMTTSIRSGEGAVKYSVFGGTDLEKQYGEGLQIHAPWVTLYRYDARVQEQLEDITALSSNGLEIGMDASIRWRPLVNDLPQLHTTYGVDYYRKLVQPELRSAVREIVGQYTPEELYSSRRTELQQQIFQRVAAAVEPQFVQVDAVLIRDISLPDQIRMAIENKLKEEQEAERYQFTIEKERLEAERKAIEAQGQAEYQRIITASLSNQFLRFKGIEATQQLANSENSKTVIVGGGGDGLPVILGNQ
ncbi:MAG: prohibitin family protein [Rhodothermales bacterium]|nr:prohibitin family protein [Rhodothermales bacterium]MBO6779628.1 prohibitin family protein [Rhodothermales bacterium]